MTSTSATRDLVTGRKSQRLLRLLLDELGAGRFSPGDQFHTISEICQAHKVSSSTAVKCLDRLVKDGVLIRRQGSGTYVRELPKDANATGKVGNGPTGAAHLDEVGPRCLDYVMPEDIDVRAGSEYLTELVSYVQDQQTDDELALRVNLMPNRLRSADEIEQWLQQRVNGGARAFIFRWMPRVAEEIAEKNGWPTCIHGHPDAGIKLPFVDHDQSQVGRLIGDHFCKIGAKHVGALMRAEWRPGDNLMINALLNRMGARMGAIETCRPFDIEVDAAVERLLDRKPAIDALVLRNHPGEWLPRNVDSLIRSGRLKSVISDWRWHPCVTTVNSTGTKVIEALAMILQQLIQGRKPNPLAMELTARLEIPTTD